MTFPVSVAAPDTQISETKSDRKIRHWSGSVSWASSKSTMGKRFRNASRKRSASARRSALSCLSTSTALRRSAIIASNVRIPCSPRRFLSIKAVSETQEYRTGKATTFGRAAMSTSWSRTHGVWTDLLSRQHLGSLFDAKFVRSTARECMSERAFCRLAWTSASYFASTSGRFVLLKLPLGRPDALISSPNAIPFGASAISESISATSDTVKSGCSSNHSGENAIASKRSLPG